jgi:TolB-like protein/Tfp pilus assembly protein PilF
MPLSDGARLGPYEILARLGAGGMGTVYRAFDTTLQRTVAIKLLNESTAVDNPAASLLHEARAASALNHPNVCTVFEVGESSGHRYIAMEFVEGRTLRDAIPADGLPVDAVLRIGAQIADAMAHAHDRRVVHRDLKSANVIVTPQNRAKVLDFGIATRQPTGSADLTISTASPGLATLAGTLAYMAPETVRGAAADTRSDIWSLGVLLYEMATGRMPFTGETVVDVSSAIVRDPPAPLPARVPRTLGRIIERCLAKAPGERYQNAGEVHAALETALADDRSTPSTPAARPSRRWAIPAAVVAAIVIAGVVFDAAGVRSRWTRGGDAGERIGSVAVLPLENLSRDAEQEFFADGMTDALINDLSKIRALRVISRTSVMRYKGVRKSLADIARELNVDAVVEGSIMRSGTRVRITAQLIHAATDRNLWANSYERDLQDALALQAEVARSIADEVKISVTPEERSRIGSARRVDPAAHEAYMRGRQQLDLRTKEGLVNAKGLFDRAIAIDATFAEAYAGLSDTYAFDGYMGFSPTTDAFRRAQEAARRSLALNEGLAEAHAAAAIVALFSWDWPGAEPEFRRAIDLNPSLATAHHWFSHYLIARNRMPESLEASRRALALEPLNANIAAHLSWAQYFARQYDDAIDQARRTIELDPGYYQGYLFRALALVAKSRYAEAIDDLTRTLTLPRVPETLALGVLAHAYAASGRAGDARKAIDRYTALSPDFTNNPDVAAFMFTTLPDHKRALDLLEQAYHQHTGHIVNIAVDPLYDPLRAEPRFKALVDKIGVLR